MKLLLSLGLLCLASHAYALGTVMSSHTASGSATSGTVFFTSAPIKFIELQVGVGGAGSVQIFRSTSSVYSTDVHLQFAFDTTTSGNNYPLHGVVNSSYTYINKSGAANVTLFFECVGRAGIGVCPGLSAGGHKEPN